MMRKEKDKASTNAASSSRSSHSSSQQRNFQQEQPQHSNNPSHRTSKKACYTSFYWAIGMVIVFLSLAFFTDILPPWIFATDDSSSMTQAQSDASIETTTGGSTDQSAGKAVAPSSSSVRVKDKGEAISATDNSAFASSLFIKTEQSANALANLIYQRYEFHRWDWFQFFLVSWNINHKGWQILKYKFAKKIILAMLKKQRQGIDRDRDKEIPFVMIFSGSSVTAGYDNYYNQSYPLIIEKRLSPVLESLGIPLIVKNIAQNRVDCRLTNYCIASMAGYFDKEITTYNPEKADVISWENSFSCSRDKDGLEYFARLAAKYDALAYLSASGGFSPINCGPSEDAVPWIAEEWKPSMVPESQKAPGFLFSPSLVSAYKQVQQDWYDDGNSVARFAGFLGEDYEGVAPHGYNAWGKSKSLCQIPSHIQKLLPPSAMKKETSQNKDGHYTGGCEGVHLIQEWCHHKRFKKSKTHGWLSETLEEHGPHWMVWDASRRGDGLLDQKTWHPPAAMHMLRGELLVYNYLHILMDAIYMIRDELSTKTNNEGEVTMEVLQVLEQKYSNELKSLQTPVPQESQYCPEWECSFTKSPTACYSEFGPMLDEHNGRSMKLSSLFIGLFDHWDKTDLIYLNNVEEFGYQDTKHYYSVSGPNRELHIKLYNVHQGVIKLYGINGKYRFQGIEIFLDPHIDRVALEAQLAKDPHHLYVPTGNRYQLKKMTYHMETDHVHITDIPPGDHVLILKTPDFHQIGRFSFSHLVVF